MQVFVDSKAFSHISHSSAILLCVIFLILQLFDLEQLNLSSLMVRFLLSSLAPEECSICPVSDYHNNSCEKTNHYIAWGSLHFKYSASLRYMVNLVHYRPIL